jgi:hypothetical protein
MKFKTFGICAKILKTWNRLPGLLCLKNINSKCEQKLGYWRKASQPHTVQKADSPGKFWERNLFFLVAYIFIICLANLITTGILIYFFLETLY